MPVNLVSSRIIEATKGTGGEKSLSRVDNFKEETFMLIGNPAAFLKAT